jgi:carbamoyltransferase
VDPDTGLAISGFETESIFLCGYPNQFDLLYRRCATHPQAQAIGSTWSDGVTTYDPSVTITKAYEAVSEYLGFGFIEAGKTMGLAPYGHTNRDIPDFFVGEYGNKNLLIPSYPAGAYIDEPRWPQLRRTDDPRAWHRDPLKVTAVAKDLAHAVQQQCEDRVTVLIARAIQLANTKNVVLSGGFALNCVANYQFLERFPDVNFWIDPIAHDGGTAIGLAKLLYHAGTGSTTITPLSSVYLGVQPNYQGLDDLLANTNCGAEQSTVDHVAALIADGNIIAVFQGAAEGGPRALGNRSIVYDPRDPQGKDRVNQVKGREWFRPFAGSVLLDAADEWFDLRGIPESPFMMYAVNVQSSKMGQLPAITHVDGTCRVQTVSRDQNPGWYDLIASFRDKTGCPVLFNTSFNLAGDPLVDSLPDAINCLLRSDIRFLWLPDVQLLITKP